MRDVYKRQSQDAVKKAIDSMKFLNKYAADILKDYEVHGCTDVTGFGFLGHLCEMLDKRHSAVVESRSIPYFQECRRYAAVSYTHLDVYKRQW